MTSLLVRRSARSRDRASVYKRCAFQLSIESVYTSKRSSNLALSSSTMYQRKRLSLREMGKSSSLSLPNIVISESIPEIQVSHMFIIAYISINSTIIYYYLLTVHVSYNLQVSSEENNVPFSTDSKEFWDETTRLLQDLGSLRTEVDEIPCPCNRSNCPFGHKGRAGNHKSSKRISLQQQSPSLRNEFLSNSARHNVATYLESMRQTRMNSLFREDCRVTEEPLAAIGQNNFVRNSPSRRAQRRHSALRVSESYPTTMNWLMVPSNMYLGVSERSNSLPASFDGPLYKGSSLDSLDSDKMHDIRKSHLRDQQHALSSNELLPW